MGLKPRTPALSDERCWSLIEENVRSEAGGMDASALAGALAALTPREVVQFDRFVGRLFSASRTWPLWGAAFLIHGGCPDDTFDYFRSWLIGRGRADYEAAMANPDNLADFADENALDDVVYAAAEDAYEAMTGASIEAEGAGWPPLDKSFDFNDTDEMRRRYPRLVARFGA